MFLRGKRFGFEFKYADAPAVTKSMWTARNDLKLERVFVVYPGRESYPLDDWVDVLAIAHVHARIGQLASGSGAGRVP